ncbi:MAG: HlyC/CorC family transporter [Clostridia bacterium]|nr:HlyC/CorC family transporter [Clostridia bacterium]
MSDDSIPRSIALILLILSSGVFASLETAYAYVNHLHMKTLADDGDRSAARVVRILGRYDDAIVAVLIMINVLHVAASLIATLLAVDLIPLPESAASAVAAVLLTVVVFIFAEMLPKAVAKDNADRLAKFYSLPLLVLLVLLTPLELFFSLFTRLAKAIMKLFSGKTAEEPTITEDEFADMVETVEEHGNLEPEETEIIKSAIEFGDAVVSDVMVPLKDVTMLDVATDQATLKETLLKSRFSRIPLYRGDRENVVGILPIRTCLWALLHEKTVDPLSCAAEPYMTAPDKRLDVLFEDMGRSKSMMAVVIDSFGHCSGIVTLEDILEEIVGEIYDEDDPETVPPADRKEAEA